MLGAQKSFYDKSGVGHNSYYPHRMHTNHFVKASSSKSSKYVCTYGNRQGHTNYYCAYKKYTYFGTKKSWISKGSKANFLRPKFIWVPKIKV